MPRFNLLFCLLVLTLLPIGSASAQDSIFTRAGIVTAGKADDPGWDQQGTNGLKLIGQERAYETSVQDDAGTDAASYATLREQLRQLREAQVAGLAEPHLLNKAMLTELDALRASRLSEMAELDELAAALDAHLTDAENA